ncbi:uncharacterized protein LOC111108042 [Crassostrea virginica]
MSKAGFFGLESREVVRVKVKKYEGFMQPESKKFSLDPQITSFEMLQHIIASAFNIKGDFTMSYLVQDDYGKEIYLSMLSDWDMDAAIQSASDPCLQLKVDAKPFEEGLDDWDIIAPVDVPRYKMSSLLEKNILGTLTGTLSSGMGKTLTHMQRAMGIKTQDDTKYKAAKPAMSDQEFRNFLDSAGYMVKPEEFRISIYQGGCEPSLRRVAWRHLLNIFPNGLSGKERFEYMKRKEKEYYDLRDQWKKLINGESMSEEMKFVTSMVKKDVLRTDRTHKFYSGSDDNKNLISLFNVLVTFALTHPLTSYCQGMSDIASPLLVTQKDEAQAYLCFCATMKRLKDNFNLNGQAITTKFKHLSDLLQEHDPELHSYFQEIHASDMFFCYRWILLELKREFPFEDALYMLEVMWSTLPPDPPSVEIALTDEAFSVENLSRSPCSPSFGMKQTVYAKLFAMRRHQSVLKGNGSYGGETATEKELAQNSVNNNSRVDSNNIEESSPIVISQEYPAMNDSEIRMMAEKSSSIDGSLKSPMEEIHTMNTQNDLEKEAQDQSSLDSDEHFQDQPSSSDKKRLTLEDVDGISMRVNWKFKCCGVITLVLVVSISYQIWYLGHGGYYNANSGYNYRKRPYSHSLVHTHKHILKVDEKIFSADEVTHFILLILKNETVTDALKSVMEDHNRQYHKNGTKLTFEASANMMLRDILHGRNKNFFLDVDERHDFDVINRTCTSIEKSLSKKGRCILSLEGTLCSDRRRLPPLVKGKKQKIEKPHRWTKQVTEICDYMYMNSSSFAAPLSYLKNPCYEACDGGYNTVRCLPYFMVIGMPKCGTTSLYFHLVQHKDVVKARKKEPMYFNRDCFKGMQLTDYTLNFEELKTRILKENNFSPLITGDGSVDIAFESWDWRNFPGNQGLREPKYVLPFFIHRVLPKLKIILVLRDPVERLFSDYIYEAPLRHYLLSLEDFHQAVHRTISKHKACWKHYSIRACAYNASLETYKARLRVGMYHVFLTDWLEIYPQSQIMVINFDDYTSDKAQVLHNVARFLELRDLSEAENKVFLADHAKQNFRSNQSLSLGNMLRETREMLRDFYRPFNANLSKLLNSDKYLWSN